MKKIACGFLGIFFLIFGITLLPTRSFADENELAVLKAQVDKLNKRIEDLEAKEQAHVPAYVAPSGQAPSGNFVEGALSGVRLTGFVDTAYHWNFDNPVHFTPSTTGAVDRNQSIGVFDTESNSFIVHAVKLALEKPVEKTGGVGFRTDLLYGQDAKVITSGGNEIDDFDLEQAYVEARLPLKALEGNKIFGDSVDIKAGKFVTLAGAEVIEAKDNWNTTRSLMFGYAIPFTHTGIRSAYGLFGDKVTVTLGLNNGWDLVEDNNNYKTFEGQVAYKPTDNLLFSATTYMGPENLNQAGHKRYLVDLVALWNVTKKFSLMGNFDIGNENRVVAAAKPFDDAEWWGYALYARYQATDKLAFATRAEIFVDDDTFRVGAGSISTATPAERHYWEWTYTTEYKLYTNLISRLEYRYDWSDAPIFQGESNQNTISAQLIYNFA